MIECSQAHWLIQEYLENNLNEVKTAQLAQHLLKCAACRDELSEMERAFALFETQPIFQPPQQVRTNVLAELSRYPEEPRFFSQTVSRRVIWKTTLSWFLGTSGIGFFMILLWIGHYYFLKFLPIPKAISLNESVMPSFRAISNWFLSALRSFLSFFENMFHTILKLLNFSPEWRNGFFGDSSVMILFGIALLVVSMAIFNKHLLRYGKRQS